MRYINKREVFIEDWKNKSKVNKSKVNEAFDMGGGSGPMGNDINWGDSLVGRLFNSIFRKIGIEKDMFSINNVIKAIKREFEAIKTESQTSSVDKNQLNRLHISYLLEALTNAVHSGTKVSIIKSITEEAIDIVDKSELSDKDKNEISQELKDFLQFLQQYDDEIGEDLSDELIGIDKEEEEKAESLQPTGGWGDKTYSGMITMFKNLIKVIENKDKSITTSQGEKEDFDKSKDVNYLKNKIVVSLKSVYNTPLVEIFVTIKDDSIYFREEKLATVNQKGQFIANIGKWDSQNKRFTKDSKPRLMDITNEIISGFSSYIANKLKQTLGENTIDKDVELKENEIRTFNEKISGKWAYMLSTKGNQYAVRIENINSNGKFKNSSIWKIEGDKPIEKKVDYGPTKISSLFKRGSIFNKQSECFNKLKQEAAKTGKDKEPSVEKYASYKGKKAKVLGYDGDKVKIELEDGKVITVNKSDLLTIESYEYLFEKTRLSKEETHANQALNRLKNSLNELITTKSKSPAIDAEFLVSVNDKASKDFMFKFANEIKSKYNQISEKIQEKPLYENIQLIDDTLLKGPKEKAQAKSLRDSAAEKIAMFASVSMLFVGEGLYGELGELGKNLDKFNNEFQKLLNTEFTEKTSESKLFRYADFISINEDKNEKEIAEEIQKYYDENVSYTKWKVTKEEVEKVDQQIKTSKPSSIGYDRIIRIVKLFNKAHKIHTTDVIPSGRKSGKVSNRTFREYEYVGDSSSGSRPATDGGVEPGTGPFRNKKVFNKFESEILSIIENSDYRDFFSSDVEITNKDGKTTEKKPGDGKILLKFINDLLDGNKLYKSGAQSKFFQEYFGFKVDDKDFGARGTSSGSSESLKPSKESSTKVELKIGKKPEIDLKKTKTFHLFKDGKSPQKKLYMMALVYEKNDNYYFKISSSSYHFLKYWKDEANYDKKPTTKEDILFFKTDKSKILEGDTLKLNYISLEDYRNNRSGVKKNEREINFTEIESFLTEDDELFKLKGNTTSGEEPDTNVYSDLVDIFR
jgi:hypothetical protein